MLRWLSLVLYVFKGIQHMFLHTFKPFGSAHPISFFTQVSRVRAWRALRFWHSSFNIDITTSILNDTWGLLQYRATHRTRDTPCVHLLLLYPLPETLSMEHMITYCHADLAIVETLVTYRTVAIARHLIVDCWCLCVVLGSTLQFF